MEFNPPIYSLVYLSGLLQGAKQVQLIAQLPLRKHLDTDDRIGDLLSFKHWPSSTDTTPLAAAVATLTHHDAITGTPEQHVAYDYAKHLAVGTHHTDFMVHDALQQMTGTTAVGTLVHCYLTNQSECTPLDTTLDTTRARGSASNVATANSTTVRIIVYNPLPRRRACVVRVPWYTTHTTHGASTSTAPLVHTRGSNGGKLVAAASSLIPAAPTTAEQAAAFLPAGAPRASHTLLIDASFEPFQARVYEITPQPPSSGDTRTGSTGSAHGQHTDAHAQAPHTSETGLMDGQDEDEAAVQPGAVYIENAQLRVDFDNATGLMSSVTDKTTGQRVHVAQQFLYYEAAVRGDGPWMFSQNHTDAFGRNASCAGGCHAKATVYKTAHAEEVHQVGRALLRTCCATAGIVLCVYVWCVVGMHGVADQ